MLKFVHFLDGFFGFLAQNDHWIDKCIVCLYVHTLLDHIVRIFRSIVSLRQSADTFQ